MLNGLIAHVAAWIIGVISAAGYAGVAGLMAIESACLPLPSEIIMPFAGYLASTGRFHLVLAATAGAIGCNIGSTAAYAVGARGGRRAVERWGRYILLSPGDLDRADRFFRRFGGPATPIADQPLGRPNASLQFKPSRVRKASRQRICVGVIRIESLVDCLSCAETGRPATPGMHGSIRAQDSCQLPLLEVGQRALSR